MARPQPRIQLTAQDEWDNIVEITEATNLYIMLYKELPFGIRRSQHGLTATFRKYLKTSYTTEAVARNAAKRLNRIFNCQDFSYQRVGIEK